MPQLRPKPRPKSYSTPALPTTMEELEDNWPLLLASSTSISISQHSMDPDTCSSTTHSLFRLKSANTSAIPIPIHLSSTTALNSPSSTISSRPSSSSSSSTLKVANKRLSILSVRSSIRRPISWAGTGSTLKRSMSNPTDATSSGARGDISRDRGEGGKKRPGFMQKWAKKRQHPSYLSLSKFYKIVVAMPI